MSRNYRERNLTQVVYILVAGDQVDAEGFPLPAQPAKRILNGLPFKKISGSSKDSNVRVWVENHEEFFRRTVIEELKAAGEDPEALGAEIISEMIPLVVADYQTCARRVGSKGEPLTCLPSLPDGTPDWDMFSLVVPKNLVENGPVVSVASAPKAGTTLGPTQLRAAIDALRLKKRTLEDKSAGEADAE